LERIVPEKKVEKKEPIDQFQCLLTRIFMKWIPLLLSSSIPFLAFCGHNQDISKLTLSASASISKPADELQMKIGVITYGLTAEEALQENSSKMRAALVNLELSGLTSDDYETNQFSIKPTYTPWPANPPPDWRQMINGYEVMNSILIHTRKLEMAGKIIDLANQAGANSINDIRFTLHSVRDHWTEALSAAGDPAWLKPQGKILRPRLKRAMCPSRLTLQLCMR
jgi:uncharacterized protein YggE